MDVVSQLRMLAFCLLGCAPASFTMAAEVHEQLGAGLMYFNYAEYNDVNRFLDGETGLVPGLVYKRKASRPAWFSEIVANAYSSIIMYDGETQDGVPLKTNSIAILIDSHFKLGKIYDNRHEPYLGLGYRYWYRQILNGSDSNGNPVSGLLEHYYWPYSMVGYRGHLFSTGNKEIGIDIRFTKMLNAKMDINFLGYKGYDNKSVDLGNRSGLRLAMPVKIKDIKNTITVTPYYEHIDIGRSPWETITKGGVPVTGCTTDPCQLYEPRSETRNIGIELTWSW